MPEQPSITKFPFYPLPQGRDLPPIYRIRLGRIPICASAAQLAARAERGVLLFNYVLRRTLASLVVLLLVSIFCFTLAHAAPGSPYQALFPPPEVRAFLEAEKHAHGLDQPIVVQYLHWVNRMLHGDFGGTMPGDAPVLPIVLEGVRRTLYIMVPSWILAILIAIPWAVYNSSRPYGASDLTATFLSYIAFAVPSFCMAYLFQEVFSMMLFWFPPSSMYDPLHYGEFLNLLPHMVLPVSVLTLGWLASYLKYTRNALLEVLPNDYIRLARAKGASERRVLYRHALRNALIPVITVMALDIPTLFGGAALVENVFNWPGMGTMLVNAARTRDYPLLMGIIMVVSVIVIAANWAADMLYAVVDPRVRTTGKAAQ
jgi:peptide/nickel transport system permease protein